MVDEFIRVASDIPAEGVAYTLKELSENSAYRDTGVMLPLLASLTVSLTAKGGHVHGGA